MKPEDFENRLKDLTTGITRPDPTPSWKADILATARAAAVLPEETPRKLPPRWLMALWGTAWAVIVLMHFSTPHAGTESLAHAAPPLPTQKPEAPVTLIAFHRDFNSYLELP